MEIRPFGPDDVAEVDAWVDLTNATSSVDSPWNRPQTRAMAVGRFRHGWDGEVDTPYLARVGDAVVGSGAISTSEYDNLELAWIRVEVHPEHRRQGHGAVILEALLDEARRRGRTIIAAEAWDTAAAHAFADRHAFEKKLASINRRQTLADIDWPELDKRYDAALPHATDYVLERWSVPTPADRLDALAVMASAINDAPTDDLDYEDEVFTPERMAAYETAMAGRGERLFRVVARHVPSGALAAQTVVAVSEEDPTWGDQHDTSVTQAHRGHRLGLLLKADMLRWLREDEPRLRTVDTWNAESNDHMIGVNEILGYRVMGREWAYQRNLD
ncbi:MULTISPECIES: GNAT family N-acetyltransferase [unclassified Nocardioides]|uniref:GNAT family N-acetyltransferase n=1 Tax=unclassified Nocardioides TaxID=2615069 RepID=UPI000A99280F|nr:MULTISPECIES: GNAT family N-acetyltransferase [unclassified Nocardioides]